MQQLAAAEVAIFDVGINSLVAKLDELGLGLEIESDFKELGRFLASEGTFVNPTYDPARSDLGAQDFWVRLLDRDGRTVACSAERTIYTQDFRMMVARGTVWYRGGFADIDGPSIVPVQTTGRAIRGKIGTSGSTYTAKAWRRHGLAMIASWLTRLISFRDFGTALNTGFVRDSLAQTTVPRQSYGYDHVELIIDGYFPPQNGPEKLYLCSIDRAEMVQRVLGLPDHPTNPTALVASNAVKPLRIAA
jgi:hypothetical protein